MDLITTHLNADFDGLASMVAARKLYPDALLVFSGGTQEMVHRFLATHDLGLTRLKDLDLSAVTRLILVDTQEPQRLGPLQPLCTNPAVVLHVYDHHPDERGHGEQGGCQAQRKLVEPVGATTTMLIEQLQQRGLALTPWEATVLALGLYDETGSFTYVSTTPRDLQAAAVVLNAGADLTVVTDTLRQPLEPDHIALLNDLLQRGETYYLDGYKVLLTTSNYQPVQGDVAEVVHRLAELKGLDAVVAAIATPGRIEVIGRSRRADIDVAHLVAEFGGGGHAGAAAATVKDRTMVEVRERLVQLLTERYRPTLLARDVMTTPVHTIAAEAGIAETEQCMTRSGVNVLPVVDRYQHFCGITTRALVRQGLLHGPATLPVQTCLQTEVYTATPATPLHTIEQHMIERHQRCVPILTGVAPLQTVVGVITRSDLQRILHDDILATARLRARGEPVPDAGPGTPRNVRGILRAYLPGPRYALLERIGRLAEAHGVSAYLVGSGVRDLLLSLRNVDLDVVIEGDGLAFAQALGQQEGARVITHARFGTAVLAFPEGFRVDVATARTESYAYPTALPTVARSSIKHDLYRRDFTINTLAIRLNLPHFGELLDCYGGQRDLKDKTLRVLHHLSFVEDPTRVLRAIRFAVRLGFQVGQETQRLIKGAVSLDLFHRLSGARFGEEIRLLLEAPEARQAVARLAEFDLLRFLHAAVVWSARLDHLLQAVDEALAWYRLASLHWPQAPAPRPAERVEPWLVRLVALFDTLPDPAVDEALQRLRLSGRHANTVRAARAARRAMPRLARRPLLSPAETFHLLAGHPVEALLFLLAKTSSDVVRQQIVAYLDTYHYVKPALTGQTLRAMGLTPGPRFRDLLNRVFEARLNGEVHDAAEERALVQRLVQERP